MDGWDMEKGIVFILSDNHVLLPATLNLHLELADATVIYRVACESREDTLVRW